MTIDRTEKDETPLQRVSTAQIKEWMRMEVDYDALTARLEDPRKPLSMKRAPLILRILKAARA